MSFASTSRAIISPWALALIAFATFFVSCSARVDDAHLSADNSNQSAPVDNEKSATPTSEVPRGEVSIKALQLFKEGDTKIYRPDLAQIPNAPPVPEIYSLKASYQVISEAVFTSAVLTVHLPPGNEAEFQQSRILWLHDNDLFPNGFEWHDCTVLKDQQGRSGKEYLPDYSKGTLSCFFEGDSSLKDQYFVLVSQTSEPRAEPLTRIEMNIERSDRNSEKGQISYLLAVVNKGPQDVGEVNFHSTFDNDVALIDVTPADGRCQGARYGSSESSAVCHIGELKAGQKTTIEFVAEPGKWAQMSATDKGFNKGWWIVGFSRKGPTDVLAFADRFSFKPLNKGK